MTLRELLGKVIYSTRIEVYEEDPKDFNKMKKIADSMSENLLKHGKASTLDREVNFFSPHIDVKGIFIAVALES